MSKGNQPEHAADEQAHLWRWPDRTSLEIRGPRWDASRRLKAEVIARAEDGQLLLNQGVIDLLNESDRARFHQNTVAGAASLNGQREELAHIDWYRRLLDTLEMVQGCGPSATGPDTTWDLPAPFYESDPPSFPTDTLPRWQRDFVEAEATATQTPPDLAGMLSLSVIAAACAKKVEVHVKEGYREPVNLYTTTALPPGVA